MTAETLASESGDRQRVLTQTRRLKMARSAHAYVRGSTRQFYTWLETSPADIPEGPPVWICGDCHLGNLGPIADPKGRVAIQIRDLDQTVVGNPAHDIIRLGLSFASAARGSDLPGVTTARMLEGLMAGYQSGLADDFDRKRDRSNRPDLIQRLLSRSLRRRWPQLAAERLNTERPRLPRGKRFWALEPDEREGLAALMRNVDVHRVVSGGEKDTASAIGLVDAAYWMKGCSSLGRVRYAVLVRFGEGRRGRLALIDVKEAVTAAAPRSDVVTMPRDNGVRVLTGAKALSPHLGARMAAGRLMDRAVVIRELAPQDLKLELARTTASEAEALAGYLGGVVGRAHGRQMDEGTRAAWARELARNQTGALDAPTWLWRSVVELVSLHEAAYLEHCRQYALARAR
jgi:uncharacterized protein (DUF2252 family)